MNSKIIRTLAVSVLVMTLALVGCFIVLPNVHAAPSSTTPTNGSSVSYGPSAGTKAASSTQVSPQVYPDCFAYVYASKVNSTTIAYSSYTDCDEAVLETVQGIPLNQCLNSGCTSYNEVAYNGCDTGNGQWVKTYCPSAPGNPSKAGGNFVVSGLTPGYTYQALLSSCSNFPIYGWGCGSAQWQVKL